jgi:hypothetical protein
VIVGGACSVPLLAAGRQSGPAASMRSGSPITCGASGMITKSGQDRALWRTPDWMSFGKSLIRVPSVRWREIGDQRPAWKSGQARIMASTSRR